MISLKNPSLIIVLLWIAVTSVVAGPDFYAYRVEQTQLHKILREIAGPNEPLDKVAILKLQKAVKERVKGTDTGQYFDVKSRPLLRHTALQVWTMKEGQCGEGARLLVNLLQIGGVPATRINLSNARNDFYHTAVAYYHEGQWWLLDTINSSKEFEEWANRNQSPLSDLTKITMHRGGTLLIEQKNPFFDRFSFVPWARIFSTYAEVNQLTALPNFANHILESPNLTMSLMKSVVVLGVFALLSTIHLLLSTLRSSLVRRL